MRFFMSPRLAVAAAAAIVALGCAAPAAATVVLYTYTGTISEGHDETGVFGTADRDLTGLAFTARFWRDDATPGAYSYENNGYTISTGALVASIAIDGGSALAIAPNQAEQNQFSTQYPGGFYESFVHLVGYYRQTDNVDTNERLVESSSLDVGVYGYLTGAYAGTHYLPNNDYHTLPSLTAAGTPGYTWQGGYSVDDYRSSLDTGDVLSRNRAYALFAPTRLTVTTIVPEPAAWALMLTGLFGAGAAIRSRRRVVACAAGQPAP